MDEHERIARWMLSYLESNGRLKRSDLPYLLLTELAVTEVDRRKLMDRFRSIRKGSVRWVADQDSWVHVNTGIGHA